MNDHRVASRFEVHGIVQGVGFRPFVFQLAADSQLKGEVANTAEGVSILVEGRPQDIQAFHDGLTHHPPPLAHIVEVLSRPEPPQGFREFSILPSRGAVQRSTLISPDTAVCDDCLGELFDPHDRRYRYPFINCTNCGPRYTIIYDIPYDRPQTSMKHFRMCPRCQQEYDNPLDRRFHAQPNACAVCGPQVFVWDRHGVRQASEDPITAAAKYLKAGRIVAIKGLGGFHLAVDGENEPAVRRLRRRKHREEKPLALMTLDCRRARRFARVSPEAQGLLTSRQRPIVLLPKATPNTIAASVAPRNNYFGVMLPYTPLHYLLLQAGPEALVMTSGNLSQEPIAIDNAEALARLGEIADFFLVHDRDIYLRSDDTIVRTIAGQTRHIRRSRGYVPIPVFLKHCLPPILACGAELKNTVCLTRGNQAFVSQHIGDLENLATLEFFRQTIEHLQRILDIRPQIVAHDLHPDYLSTRYALGLEGVQKVAVQHHHAHVAACMAENQLDGTVIGLSFDGTGYGTDGTIWGGEVLVADTAGFERAAHLAPVPMPGSAAAIRQPWRMALSYLQDAYGTVAPDIGLPLLTAIGAEKPPIIDQMIRRGVNSPLTSSLGRLFDGVAALVGLRREVAFEGQAAMELEMVTRPGPAPPYPFEWSVTRPYRVATAPMIRGVVEDVLAGRTAGEIGSRFHATLIELFCSLCGVVRSDTGLRRVVLSGGVFQNARLLTGIHDTLAKNGFDVYAHRSVPTNDGGISLGQAVVAAAGAS